MRVIFSRKGFDSAYGGYASPILPDGTPVSFPIPEAGSGIRYADLRTPSGSMFHLMQELGITRYRENGAFHALTKTSETHLDPDIFAAARPRAKEWLPVFGQCSAAQGHLDTQGVEKGDLFLFFGTFRETRRVRGTLQFSARPVHLIFGYMLVGEIIRVNGSTSLSWCAEHPHLLDRNRSNNTLYIAPKALPRSTRPGADTLKYSPTRVLTDQPGIVSRWRLPSFFHPDAAGRALSRHGKAAAWSKQGKWTLLQTKSPGQEYVIEATPEIAAWARSIISDD